MAKELTGFIKLQVKGGAANPAPPIGPALGSKGVNIMDFCKQFNARTQDKAGKILPVVISVYSDKSFDFIVKTPPVASQLMEAAKITSGSAESNRKKVKQYYDNHSDFFINKDLPWGHPYLSTGAIPLADLIEAPENYLEILATHRCVKDVYFI